MPPGETSDGTASAAADGARDGAERALVRLRRWHERLVVTWAEGAPGWAPECATEILARSRLDRQASLCACLGLWLDPAAEVAQEEGQLILAWTNLGALVEGTLKLLLSIFAHDYGKEPMLRKGVAVEPDDLSFEELRQFYARTFLLPSEAPWADWLGAIQRRRNAVHAFKQRDIGTHADFLDALVAFERFGRLLESRIPYGN